MRILCATNMYPSPADPDYGAFVRSMCRALEGRGHEVDLAAIDSRASGALATPRKYFGLASDTARRAGGADVIYAHYLVPTGAIAAAAGALGRTPVVLTAHGGDVALLGRAGPRSLARFAIDRAAHTIAVSSALARELEAALGPERSRALSVINMGVDLERFDVGDRQAARASLGLPSGPLVLAVGGLTDRKNPLALLQALERLRVHVPDARLAFVGDGPLRSMLELASERLGLGDAVTFAGAIPHDEVPVWMAACDVLALVSKREPLGQVALEALASGRPVVATSVGGTPEIVPARGPGRVVDPRDPGAIAEALCELLARPPAPEDCRAAARPNALSTQATAVANVLESAIHARSRYRFAD